MTARPPHRPLLLRSLVGAVVVALVVLATAGVASAHASLVGTDPADGQSLPTAPTQVSARFSEDVSVEVGGLTVRDRLGDRVDQGTTTVEASGSTISIALQGGLPDGTYIATYRVLSADGHPVSGSWVFGVGSGPVDALGTGGTGDAGWELVGAVARFVTYLFALLAAGLAVFLAFVHDQGADRRRLGRILRGAAAAALVGVVGTVAAQAALLTGRGLGGATDASVLRSVLGDRLGWASAAVLLGLAAVHLSTDLRERVVAQVLAFYGGLAVVASFALWGHDTEAPARWLSVASDVVHVAAAAVWLGGLVGLVVVLARPRGDHVASSAAVVGRFSTVAGASVLALVAAGTTMAWIETGSLDALVSTTYGRLVLAKSALTLVIVAMAAHNRFRLVPAVVADATAAAAADGSPRPAADAGAPRDASHPAERAAGAPEPGRVAVAEVEAGGPGDPEDALGDGPRGGPWRRLRRTVGLEAVAIVVVLGLTAVLVNTTPGRTEVDDRPRVVELSQPTTDGQVDLLVTPAKAGTNSIHIQYTDAAGRPDDVTTTLDVELALPAKDLGPITRQVLKIAPGHFVVEGDELSVPGEWTITLSARTGEFSLERTTFTVPIS